MFRLLMNFGGDVKLVCTKPEPLQSATLSTSGWVAIRCWSYCLPSVTHAPPLWRDRRLTGCTRSETCLPCWNGWRKSSTVPTFYLYLTAKSALRMFFATYLSSWLHSHITCLEHRQTALWLTSNTVTFATLFQFGRPREQRSPHAGGRGAGTSAA